jgi:hypothetical protein
MVCSTSRCPEGMHRKVQIALHSCSFLKLSQVREATPGSFRRTGLCFFASLVPANITPHGDSVSPLGVNRTTSRLASDFERQWNSDPPRGTAIAYGEGRVSKGRGGDPQTRIFAIRRKSPLSASRCATFPSESPPGEQWA